MMPPSLADTSGPEIIEIRLSELENHRTLGAEYYAHQYVLPQHQLMQSRLEKVRLADCCSLITDGDHGSAEYADTGVCFILSEAVEKGVVRREACRLITPAHASTLKRSELHIDDVLVTKTGVYFGNSAVVQPEFANANTIAHVAVLRPKSFVDPYYLSTFLNCRFGQAQLRRRGLKATRPEIKLVEFDDIMVPLAPAAIVAQVRELVRQAVQIVGEANARLQEAEGLVDSLVGFDESEGANANWYVRDFSEAAAAQRFDAEYFHPVKGNALARLAQADALPLGSICESVRDQFDPSKATGFVRNFDLNDALSPTLDDSKEPVDVSTLGSVKRRLIYGDVVISRLRSYLREISIVQTSASVPSVGSSEFVVLRLEKDAGLTAASLATFLRSKAVQAILRWSQDGSNHPRFGEADLLAIPVPGVVIDHGARLDELFTGVIQQRARASECLAKAELLVEQLVLDSAGETERC